jgi:hypothetical protein
MRLSQPNNIVYKDNSPRETLHTTTGNEHRSNVFADKTPVAPVPSSTHNVLSSTAIPNENDSALSVPSPAEMQIESADTAVAQIQGDKSEAQYIIANYGIDPVELLHMGKSF